MGPVFRACATENHMNRHICKATSKVISVLLAGLLIGCLPEQTAPTASGRMGSIVVRYAYVTQNIGSDTSAAYMQIENAGDVADRLLSLSSPVAGSITLHDTINNGGLMSMLPLPDGIPLPPNSTIELKTAGLHAMLEQVKGPLKPGETVPIALRFSAGKVLELAVPVRAPTSESVHSH